MLQDNATHLHGHSILELCHTYGTPLYVYDLETIRLKYNKFTRPFRVPSLRVNYAVKALSNPHILKEFRLLGAGLDTVSLQEIKLALLAGFTPDDIIYTPNGVSHEELDEAVKMGVHINIDKINMLEYFGHHHPGVPVSIRFNPHVMAGGNNNISVGHIDSKFGISIHQLPLVKRITGALQMRVNGVHMHTGSDILDVEVFLYAADILLETARAFDGLEFIDFGSGFKVKYKEDDNETCIEEFGDRMSRRFMEFCEEYGRELTLIFEPGKYLVSEAGWLFVRTNLIKQTTSTIFASVDSGFNHFVRPMYYRAHHEIYNVSNPEGKPRIYSVVGYICESDTFGWNRRISEISEGDILGFKNAGAYCFSMASNYNSRFRPAEITVDRSGVKLIRERETMDDLLRNVPAV